jgi:hypothetical protein
MKQAGKGPQGETTGVMKSVTIVGALRDNSAYKCERWERSHMSGLQACHEGIGRMTEKGIRKALPKKKSKGDPA